MVDTAMGATKPSFRPYVSSNISGLPEVASHGKIKARTSQPEQGLKKGIYITSLNSS
jgi:hypothetical protein